MGGEVVVVVSSFGGKEYVIRVGTVSMGTAKDFYFIAESVVE
jgi:hypothetical protein